MAELRLVAQFAAKIRLKQYCSSSRLMLYALFDSLNIVQFVCHCHNVTQMLKSSH